MTSDHLKLLADTVQQISLARDLKTIMEVIRTSARKMTGADGATFILKDNDLCYYADEDAIGPLWKGQKFPLSQCVSGWVIKHRQPVTIEDIYRDDRVPIEAYRPTFVKSLTVVPIRTIDPVGAIGNYWASVHRSSEEEIQLLQSLADVTSVAIENIYIYNELEERVKQRTAELEKANRELETFSFSVSHDLRAPLRHISIRLSQLRDMYADKKLNGDTQQLIQSTIDKVHDMNQLIDSLLDFSAIDKKDLNLEPISMKKMVEEICEGFKEQEKLREIHFDIQDLPDIAGDLLLIKQVWINLLSNAVKYTAYKEKAVIEVGFECTGDFITYSVIDNGAGFDMNFYDKLFTEFQRLHSQRDFKGNGIGLALAQRILVRHGGRLWANSHPGNGAEFYFSLPVESRSQKLAS